MPDAFYGKLGKICESFFLCALRAIGKFDVIVPECGPNDFPSNMKHWAENNNLIRINLINIEQFARNFSAQEKMTRFSKIK